MTALLSAAETSTAAPLWALTSVYTPGFHFCLIGGGTSRIRTEEGERGGTGEGDSALDDSEPGVPFGGAKLSGRSGSNEPGGVW